jgi:hypothetical protein
MESIMATNLQAPAPAESDEARDTALAEEVLAASAPPSDEPASAPEVASDAASDASTDPASRLSEPTPQAREVHGVPIAEYLRERDERLNVQRQLEAYRAREKPTPRPDPFLDPQGFVDAQLRAQMDPVLRQLSVAIAHNNKTTAASVHGGELTERAQAEFDKALPGLDPVERNRVMGSPNPFLAAVDWLKQKELLAEIGGDAKAYRERILSEALSDPEFLGRASEAARSFAAGNLRPLSRASTKPQALPSLNGDGTSDFLWRNQNGTLVDWTMNGSQIASSQVVTSGGNPAMPNSSWNVAGIGDFNGDGKDDVLWRNTNGSLVDWTMNGSQVMASQQVTFGGSAATPDSSWSVAGIGDFNGDGKADVLWRNTNGSLVDWTMNGSEITSAQAITFGGSTVSPDSSWSVVRIGDFNGDGKADILWRNTNGTLIDWTMNGSQIASEQQVTFGGNAAMPNSSWQIAQIGDFNGNGSSDILWRNANGAMEEWSMNGAQIASASSVTLQGSPVTPPLSWNTLSKPTDFV